MNPDDVAAFVQEEIRKRKAQIDELGTSPEDQAMEQYLRAQITLLQDTI
jgi:hypothetical protein